MNALDSLLIENSNFTLQTVKSSQHPHSHFIVRKKVSSSTLCVQFNNIINNHMLLIFMRLKLTWNATINFRSDVLLLSSFFFEEGSCLSQLSRAILITFMLIVVSINSQMDSRVSSETQNWRLWYWNIFSLSRCRCNLSDYKVMMFIVAFPLRRRQMHDGKQLFSYHQRHSSMKEGGNLRLLLFMSKRKIGHLDIETANRCTGYK